MAISTLDGLRTALRTPHAPLIMATGVIREDTQYLIAPLYGFSTLPPSASAPSPGLGGAALTSYGGQIPWRNPAAGNTYLAQINLAAKQPGVGTASNGGLMFVIYDRLWHNSGIGITTTTGQTINSVAWPARDRGGSTDGDDVLVGLEVSTITGNSGTITNTTITYTNSAGTGSRTGTMAAFPPTARVGTFVPFELAAGDQGIRSIQTLTLGTSYVSGTVHLVAYRKVAQVQTHQSLSLNRFDPIQLCMPRLYDDSVLFLLFRFNSATAGESMDTQGSMSFVAG